MMGSAELEYTGSCSPKNHLTAELITLTPLLRLQIFNVILFFKQIDKKELIIAKRFSAFYAKLNNCNFPNKPLHGKC
jgi:hypothetical protein